MADFLNQIVDLLRQELPDDRINRIESILRNSYGGSYQYIWMRPPVRLRPEDQDKSSSELARQHRVSRVTIWRAKKRNRCSSI